MSQFCFMQRGIHSSPSVMYLPLALLFDVFVELSSVLQNVCAGVIREVMKKHWPTTGTCRKLPGSRYHAILEWLATSTVIIEHSYRYVVILKYLSMSTPSSSVAYISNHVQVLAHLQM